MKKLITIIFILIFVLNECKIRNDIKKFDSTIEFNEELIDNKISILLPNTKLKTNKIGVLKNFVTISKLVEYVIQIVNIKKMKQMSNELFSEDIFYDSIIKGSLKPLHGRLLYKKNIEIDGIQGKEFRLKGTLITTKGKRNTRCFMFIHKEIGYVIRFRYRNIINNESKQEIEKALYSIKLIKPSI